MLTSSALRREASLGALLLASSTLLAPGAARAGDTPAATAPAAGASTTDPAAAALDAGGGDITVTARHREEKLRDVPLAISAISGSELAAKRLDRVGDYALKIPNFSALQQNTRVSGLYIRGLGGNASNDGAEGGVGLIVDNVFFTHVGFSWLDFVDLDSIEVVRGPQGTLLGKNTTVGAVIVQTAKPSFTPSLTASASYANHEGWQIRTNATGPLIADKLAYRLTFATSQGGGYIPNALDGTKYLNNNRWSVRGQLLYTPTADITSRLIVEHYETHEYNNYYPVVGDVNQNLNPYTGAVVSQRTGSWSNKLINNLGYTPNTNGPFNAALNNQQRLVSRTDGVSNELNWDLGSTTLTSVTAWRRLYFRPYNDSDYTPLPIYRAGYDVDVNQYSQELRLASQKGGKLDWQGGIYYLHEDLRSNLRTIFGQDASAFFISAATPSAVLNGVEYDRDGHLHIDSIAGFGQGTYHLTEALSLTAGLRYTYEKKKVNVYGYSLGGDNVSGNAVEAATRSAVLAGTGGTSAAAGGTYAIGGEADRGSFAWVVNPSWKANEHVLFYASASYGEKSGAANTSATYAQANLILTKPEKSLDFEGGVKTNWWRGKASANLNFYNNTITDYQSAQVDSSNASFGTYLANVGKVRMRGFEFEANLHPVPAISLDFNAAYNDAKYLSYDNAPAPIEYQAYLGGSNASLSLTGYQITGAPRWTLQGGVDLNQPIGHDLVLTGYANTSWKSRVALINPRSIYGWQNAVAITNVGLGVKTEDGRWLVQGWAKNVLNRRYAVAYSPATASAPINEVLGDTRSYGLTVTRKF